MTKEQLLQVFQDFSEQYGESYEQRAIFDNDFGDLADAILKQPAALDLIAQEREKQISKGYTVEHDAAYVSRTGVDCRKIAENLLNQYQCPPEWDNNYWQKLCNLPYKARLRIAATWYLRSLEVLQYLEKKGGS